MRHVDDVIGAADGQVINAQIQIAAKIQERRAGGLKGGVEIGNLIACGPGRASRMSDRRNRRSNRAVIPASEPGPSSRRPLGSCRWFSASLWRRVIARAVGYWVPGLAFARPG
ncbi:hypothetical protein [Breoghania sp. L-A4]|uniref:hypothetical protein n=1 Tax=Breoghania sp. L-A4 TaxID=2304600 RepID=UPI0020BE9F41|nr:hypothetical protein [Breoghania sp. L-A4]